MARDVSEPGTRITTRRAVARFAEDLDGLTRAVRGRTRAGAGGAGPPGYAASAGLPERAAAVGGPGDRRRAGGVAGGQRRRGERGQYTGGSGGGCGFTAAVSVTAAAAAATATSGHAAQSHGVSFLVQWGVLGRKLRTRTSSPASRCGAHLVAAPQVLAACPEGLAGGPAPYLSRGGQIPRTGHETPGPRTYAEVMGSGASRREAVVTAGATGVARIRSMVRTAVATGTTDPPTPPAAWRQRLQFGRWTWCSWPTWCSRSSSGAPPIPGWTPRTAGTATRTAPRCSCCTPPCWPRRWCCAPASPPRPGPRLR